MKHLIAREPSPGAPPGTLVVAHGERPHIRIMDYSATQLVEHDVISPDEIITYLTDDLPSTTWIDVRGIGDAAIFERLGAILGLHPLALEDVVNAPQRPKTDVYAKQQIVIARMVRLDEGGSVCTEQLGMIFGDRFVLTVQESDDADVLDVVRARLRGGKGRIRIGGSDYLAYALLDAVIDGFYPVLDALGERLEDLELEATDVRRPMSRPIHAIKRELLTARRAIWPQRDMLSSLLRDESPHISHETRVYLRDTYDHAVQVMDMVETFREIASGLMDLYLSSVSNRMNEIMKVLTILSTIFLPMTFIAGVYGMNFDTSVSPTSMPELHWRHGYLAALGLMAASAIGLLVYYRRKGWLGGGGEPSRD
jgi:magnesium transporter